MIKTKSNKLIYHKKQCIDNLNELSKSSEVTVNWIPGHQNYDGNEIADLLANCGKSKPIEANTFPVPSSFINSLIKNCYQLSETTLQNLPLSNEAKHITYKLLESGKFNPMKISKKKSQNSTVTTYQSLYVLYQMLTA